MENSTQNNLNNIGNDLNNFANDEKNMVMLCHFGQLMGGIVIPLIIWMMKKETMLCLDKEAKKIINFQISMIIYSLVSMALCFVIIGFLLLPVVIGLTIVCPIIGGVKCMNDEEFNYPFAINFIK